jgi:hypothetical protein
LQLVQQTGGLVDSESRLVLAMSPGSAVALTATNSFNVNVYDLLKKNFPNIRFETAVQYGAKTASNPQGVAAGNLVQLIAERSRARTPGIAPSMRRCGRIRSSVRLSSFKKKMTGGTWGAVIRMPVAFAQMVGV